MLGLHIAKQTSDDVECIIVDPKDFVDGAVSQEGLARWIVEKRDGIKRFFRNWIGIPTVIAVIPVALTMGLPLALAALIGGGIAVVISNTLINVTAWSFKTIFDIIKCLSYKDAVVYMKTIESLQSYATELGKLLTRKSLSQADVTRFVYRMDSDADLKYAVHVQNEVLKFWGPFKDDTDRKFSFKLATDDVESLGYTPNNIGELATTLNECIAEQYKLANASVKLSEANLEDTSASRQLFDMYISTIKMSQVYIEWYRKHDMPKVLGQCVEQKNA